MTKPPAGSSLLFGALADSGRIKQRKNGSYRMVLKGIDEIDWFTDRPDRAAGEWSPKKLLKEWDVLFSDGAPNAQATFDVDSKRELVAFEMFKPKLRDSNQKLSFKIDGIGEKNKDLLTGLKNKRLSDASLFIDDGTTGDTTVTMQAWNSSGWTLAMQTSSSDAVFGNPSNVSGYTNEQLDEGTVYFTGGGENCTEGVIEVPVTLMNGLQTPSIEVQISSEDVWDIGSSCNMDDSTTVYYTIDGGATQSVEATCYMNEMQEIK